MVRTRHGGMVAGIVAATVLLAVPSSSGAAAPDAHGAPAAVDVSGAAGDRPIDCRGWAWPQAHAVRNTKPVYSLGKWGGAVDVTLWRGDAGPRGEWHYWAALTGRTRPGDAVWLEVWPPGGGPWHRCGPFPVTGEGRAVTSPMALWSRFTLVRACARHDDVSACGPDKGAMVD